MPLPPNNPPKGGLNMQDVLFVLFKHKWMILLLTALGLGAAAAVYKTQAPLYQSQAKLLVRYVLVRDTVDSFESHATPGTGRVDSVINTEIEILTSVDLALEVAERIGVAKLLPESGGNASLSDAAGVILSELQVGVGQSNNVLHLVYANEDPQLATQVLQELVARYFQKHLEIHRSAAAFDLVAQQTAEVRQRLKMTEDELNQLRTESGIVSLADATGALSAQRAKTNEDLMIARAELAEQQARLTSMERDTEGTLSHAVAETPDAPSGNPPPHAVSEYRSVMELLAFLHKKQLELSIKFKPGHRLLAINQQQLAGYEARQRSLLARFPALAAQADPTQPESEGSEWNMITEKARLAAITAKIEVFESHIREIANQFSEQYAIGARIDELERLKQMEEAEYRSLESNLKNARIDQTLDPSRMPNITVVQHPSQPVKSYDEVTRKLIMGLAGGGMALGLGLAFLIELLLDRRVKRPIEIQTRLQLPLLLSIPYMRRKERVGLLMAHDPGVPRIGGGSNALAPPDDDEAFEPPSRRNSHFILPYSETIRDRIIFNFEVNNVTHKPKLVAVTGLSEGAGTSTIAAGLAKSFSEISGMKVLLVDLSSYHPEDSPLFGEIPRHSIHAALHLASNHQFRENSQSLYYASATARRDEAGLKTFSPVHLHELMPHLHASQYDYIIFDMPPVDQTSRTLTMAGMMDKVLLVLDAEHTSRDALLWGYSELVKGKADVSCVFNKARSHVPAWLPGGN